MKKPKFKIGDIVQMKDEFHFNPCYKVTSIGQIQSIHIHEGEEVGHKTHREPLSLKGKIIYCVSGFSLMPNEKVLSLYKSSKL